MKKVLSVISLVLVAFVALTACAAKGGVQKNFEKEGYTVETVKYDDMNATVKSMIAGSLTEDQKKNLAKYEVMVCNKGLNFAVIVVFPSAGDLKKFLTDSDGNTTAYDKAKDAKQIRKECWLLIGDTDVFNK